MELIFPLGGGKKTLKFIQSKYMQFSAAADIYMAKKIKWKSDSF